jgi:hypothetical protein
VKPCYCENEHCTTCHGDGCDRPASATMWCDYIGNICDACALDMPDEYMHRRTEVGAS